MRFQTYSSGRGTNALWLNTLPGGWKELRGKRIFKQVRTPKKIGDEQLSATQKYGVVPQNQFMEQEGSRVVLALSGTDNFRHVDKDDFVISLRSFQGGIERCHFDGCVSPAYTILKKSRKISEGFFSYLLKCEWFISALQIGITGIREGKNVSYEEFGDIILPFPDSEEQTAIARFLDRETARIDGLIEKKGRFIELLKEKRAALITHAVTKGIDAGVPMKDGGFKALGSIPEHWNLNPLGRALRLNKRTVGKRHADFTLLSLTTRGIIVRDISENAGKFPESFETYQEVCPGNFVFCLFDMDETPRTVGRSEVAGMITGAYSVFECIDPVYSSFLLYLFLHLDTCKGLKPFYTGLRKTIRPPRFASIRVPFPPVEEAARIVSYIEDQTARIDGLIAKTDRSIELLKEKRSALITAAVTGKIDVRNAA